MSSEYIVRFKHTEYVDVWIRSAKNRTDAMRKAHKEVDRGVEWVVGKPRIIRVKEVANG